MTNTLAPTMQTSLNLTSIATVNIRALCARSGYSASDLARALKMNRTALGYRWRGQTDWRLEELEQIAVVFGTTPWDLITPAFGDKWNPDTKKLPRLDSNQQPAD
ncbi:helix-turn-helix transcriptional regulator [Mobiluncus curtisii]|uniref:Helix-turn-helix transcriptional regulator n=2 Tax=Mobiluncus curtisii TaxID=2051 RepID=A0A7Y0YCV8_9ACTO|nr:helix-turn-helix transcriptional regulator [Mobiluncus curtisii]